MTRLPNLYLVWLEWPEKCFRVDAKALRALTSLVPRGSRVVRVRSEAAFLRALPQATHAIVWSFRKEWFANAPRLRLLATPAAGQELVPTEGPAGVRIHFGHFQGQIMAESVVAFVLAWARGFFFPERAQGAWPRTALSGRCYEVAGTKAVIVGYGNVGRAVGEKLRALGVEVAGFGRRNIAKLPQELPSADWLILALPSTTGTDDFLNAARLGKLPRRCVVVNVGRGNAVDERALYAALKARRIAGAYLDVRKHESSGVVLDFGRNAKGLESLDNCILMPHASAFSPQYFCRCFEELKNDGCL